MTAIADTSFVVAVVNKTDKGNKQCRAVYEQYSGPIYLPQTTFSEIAYLLHRERDNVYVSNFLLRLPEMKFRIIALEPEDILRTAEILKQYADARLDFVDVTIVAIAERMRIGRILTLDQRDFSIVRPRHRDHFELLPQA
jgi:uncharacterized protein